MPIEFNCPACSKPLKVPDQFAGRKGKCPSCGNAILVPAVAAEQEPADIYALAEDTPPPRKKLSEIDKVLYSAVGEPRAEEPAAPAAPAGPREAPAGSLDQLASRWLRAMADGELETAGSLMRELSRRGAEVRKIVKEWVRGADRPIGLDDIPAPVLQGFFKQLLAKLGG